MSAANNERNNNAKIRQRNKNGGGNEDKKAKITKTATAAEAATIDGSISPFTKWMIICSVLGILSIGIVLYLSRKLSTRWQKEMDRQCDNGTGKCIVIGDFSEDFGLTWLRGMFFVNKTTVQFEKMFTNIGAELVIKCSTNEEFDKEPPVTCVPDHELLGWPYVATMAIMPFVVGALDHPMQIQQQQSQSAMIVGLGGGTLDMFLHKKVPNLNITIYELDPMVVKMAAKWFGTVDDFNRRTILADGLVAIEKAAKNGEQFDLVALDACEMFGQLVCPPPSFTAENALKNIKAILKPSGVFVVNAIMADSDEETNYIAEQKRKLLSVFPICLHTQYISEMSNIFICLSNQIKTSELKSISKKWEKKREELAKKFGLGEMLAKYRIV